MLSKEIFVNNGRLKYLKDKYNRILEEIIEKFHLT